MRGDQKWPPQSVKEAVAAENEARMMLAKGPACRPRKVHRLYLTDNSYKHPLHSLLCTLPDHTYHYSTYRFKVTSFLPAETQFKSMSGKSLPLSIQNISYNL